MQLLCLLIDEWRDISVLSRNNELSREKELYGLGFQLSRFVYSQCVEKRRTPEMCTLYIHTRTLTNNLVCVNCMLCSVPLCIYTPLHYYTGIRWGVGKVHQLTCKQQLCCGK